MYEKPLNGHHTIRPHNLVMASALLLFALSPVIAQKPPVPPPPLDAPPAAPAPASPSDADVDANAKEQTKQPPASQTKDAVQAAVQKQPQADTAAQKQQKQSKGHAAMQKAVVAPTYSYRPVSHHRHHHVRFRHRHHRHHRCFRAGCR